MCWVPNLVSGTKEVLAQQRVHASSCQPQNTESRSQALLCAVNFGVWLQNALPDSTHPNSQFLFLNELCVRKTFPSFCVNSLITVGAG